MSVTVLDVVDLAEDVALVVAAHLVALGEVGGAVVTSEALGVELRLPDLPHLLSLGEALLADGAAGSEHSVEVLLAIELAKLGEAGVSERSSAGCALETVLVQTAVPHPQHVLVLDRSVTLAADLHVRHSLSCKFF